MKIKVRRKFWREFRPSENINKRQNCAKVRYHELAMRFVTFKH